MILYRQMFVCMDEVNADTEDMTMVVHHGELITGPPIIHHW